MPAERDRVRKCPYPCWLGDVPENLSAPLVFLLDVDQSASWHQDKSHAIQTHLAESQVLDITEPLT